MSKINKRSTLKTSMPAVSSKAKKIKLVLQVHFYLAVDTARFAS
jgi:hypothetical protein